MLQNLIIVPHPYLVMACACHLTVHAQYVPYVLHLATKIYRRAFCTLVPSFIPFVWSLSDIVYNISVRSSCRKLRVLGSVASASLLIMLNIVRGTMRRIGTRILQIMGCKWLLANDIFCGKYHFKSSPFATIIHKVCRLSAHVHTIQILYIFISAKFCTQDQKA